MTGSATRRSLPAWASLLFVGSATRSSPPAWAFLCGCLRVWRRLAACLRRPGAWEAQGSSTRRAPSSIPGPTPTRVGPLAVAVLRTAGVPGHARVAHGGDLRPRRAARVTALGNWRLPDPATRCKRSGERRRGANDTGCRRVGRSGVRTIPSVRVRTYISMCRAMPETSRGERGLRGCTAGRSSGVPEARTRQMDMYDNRI
mmetsp:Transcript_27946/g.65175  ORF Transcript_27946/g.65175 Transcript_27946/m.65175 type:complete len:201 (+) Transcript_27946:705-1307(+)